MFLVAVSRPIHKEISVKVCHQTDWFCRICTVSSLNPVYLGYPEVVLWVYLVPACRRRTPSKLCFIKQTIYDKRTIIFEISN